MVSKPTRGEGAQWAIWMVVGVGGFRVGLVLADNF